MMESFQSDIEYLRKEHEALRARIEGITMREPVEEMEASEIPRIVPPAPVYESVFEVIGGPSNEQQQPPLMPSSTAFAGLATASSTTTSPYYTTTAAEGIQISGKPSIFRLGTETPIVRPGGIFKERPLAEGVSVPVERVPSAALKEEYAGIQGSTEGLVAPPTTPTAGFLPIVQAPAELSVSMATQAPSSESSFSESLNVVPEVLQAMPLQEVAKAPLPKTYLIPCDINADPKELSGIVSWTLQNLVKPADAIKILISGELQGHETNEGIISHMIGNASFQENKEQLRELFPLLVQMIEATGLDRVPFQVEIRRQESLGWSMRSEFQWPHVNEQLIVVVPSHAVQVKGSPPASSFESMILQSAPCPVVEYPTLT